MNSSLPADIKNAIAGTDVPDVFLPYQADVLTMTAIHLVLFIEKSRRIGVTWALAADAVLVAGSARGQGGMDVFYMGYNLEMAREFIDVCASWAKAFNTLCGDVNEFVFDNIDENGNTREIKAFRIQFSSGFEIVALPSSPRSLRGKQGYVIVDEAAFHDDLAELLKSAYALLIWGGKLVVTSTHDGVDNPFNREILAIREKRKGYQDHAVMRITFQDAIDDGLYERICLVKGEEPSDEGKADFVRKIYSFYGEGAAEELDVVPKNSAGIYFPSVLVEPCMIDVPIIKLELKEDFFLKDALHKSAIISEFFAENLQPLFKELNPDLRHYFGFDFARSGDLGVWSPLAVEKNMRRTTPFMLEMRNVPFSQQEQLLTLCIRALPCFSSGFMDATGNGAQIAEKMQELFGGSRVHAIKINVAWYEEALPPYRAALQDQMMFIPRHADILQDHRTATVVKGVPQIPTLKGSDKKQRHGDSLIALAGAYWASTQEAHDYGYQSAFQAASPRDFLRQQSADEQVLRSRRFGNLRGGY